jgi:lipopolysaccharide export system protein LptA
MIWQRRVRIGLAVAGLASAAAVLLLARARPTPGPPMLVPTDSEAVYEGGATTSSRLEGALENVTASFDSWKEYEDGRMWYSGVHLRFHSDGFELWADEAIARKRPTDTDTPGEVDLSGHVRAKTTDGLEVETPTATYRDETGVVVMPGEVKVVKGRMTATGMNGQYDRRQDLFVIQEQAHVVLTAGEDGGEPVDATSASMTMARAEQFLRMDGGARIVRSRETLVGDAATVYFTEATEDVRLLDLRGHASVTPAAGIENPPPGMRGDTIALAFHPGGQALRQATLTGSALLTQAEPGGTRSIAAPWIDLRTGADGQTVIGLEAKDHVVVELPAVAGGAARTITSSTLAARGAEPAGLETARFEGGVEFVERTRTREGASVRTGRSQALQLALDGGFEEIDEAEFLSQVTFVSADTTASAERAIYAQKADSLHLFTVPGRRAAPHVENDRLTIDAAEIRLGLGGSRVNASGNVRTVNKPDDKGGADRKTASALFDGGSTVLGAAESLDYDGDAGRATYTGNDARPARLEQDANALAGRVIVVNEDTGDVQAEGVVESRFTVERKPAAGAAPSAPAEYTVRADSLVYVESERVATYRGSPVHLLSGDAETEAGVVTLTLADAERDVKTVVWQAAVYVLFEKVYEALGERLLHDVASGDYTLEGAPAITKMPDESRTQCAKQTGQKTIFNRQTGDGAWPTEANSMGRISTEKIPCSQSIRIRR